MYLHITAHERSHSSGCEPLPRARAGAMELGLARVCEDFLGGSDSKASVYDVGDPGSIPGLGRSLGEGNGNPLQYSCLGNYMNRGA